MTRPSAAVLAAALGLAAVLGRARPGAAQERDWNPVAHPEATVVSGDARFTVLTDRLLRMEWAGDGRFEDRASTAFVDRRLPVPSYEVRREE
ncbi:MAG: hypothetical protein ABEJ46_01060, partial [Gemmatimonadota bacterium]